MMDTRLPIFGVLAIFITFVLFWIMQALVGVSGELKEGGKPPSVDFVRLKRDTTPKVKEREPPKREKPEQPPPPPQMNLAQNMNPGDAAGEIVPMADAAELVEEATSLGAGGGDREVVPLVRVEAQYPPRAQERGIEGYVDIEFTVAASGTVKDPIVLRSQPPAIFDRAAIQAVKKWRYNPRIENGKPVEFRTKIRMLFELDV